MASKVVHVSPSVKRFRPGDRVLGLGYGWELTINSPAKGAFQSFALLCKDTTTSLPL